ncbi:MULTISPECIES: GntR family transcriptional regulator [unclassified Brenneria]|uniref:GntR family transcriptional regulator n=1 Tax=unclassified Brenneria TaxID=2634434 RepID=UPI0029C34643|nr:MULTISPECIES: GntR family transcriptional regulator [unclassified Brenneria]MDX5627600.1 GntR family transcriptional regulator [Brenneria sp. L3-3Z]MDX5695309.1 GntR family transcriptional regulator [Brenneria sp. L4-2C]MEE3664168.1 GntR family transcriptional regulator [Brenneria sp. g21c3]
MIKRSRLKPLTKNSIETQTTDSLRSYILSGSVKPGDRLTETSLAEQLGVGRATVRSAFQRLSGEGILVQIPYTGWEVSSLSINDVWELWTLRGSLEGLAARLAAEHTDPAQRQAIERAYRRLEDDCAAGDMKDISESDMHLHHTIVNAANHQRLAHQYTLVEQQVRLYIMTSNVYTSDGPADIFSQHTPMVEALLAGDGPRASQEAWRHNETEGKKLSDWLKQQNGQDAAIR